MESLMVRQLKSLIEEEPYYLPVLANASALIMESLEDLNWAGFYLMRDGRLVLGPFQGKTACIHIDPGRGVCGTAAKEDRTLNVPDVHVFTGHIACDGASNSEIVIPLHDPEGRVIGVMDLDSPVYERFNEKDRQELEAFAGLLEKSVRWDSGE